MKNPTRNKMAAGVALAEMRGQQRQYTHDRGPYKAQKIQLAKMAVAKAAVIWNKVKMEYSVDDTMDWPWMYGAQRDFNNAVERLRKLTGEDDE